MASLGRFGVCKPTILLPRKGTDLSKWAVIACDQYTSDPDYWKRVEQYVGSAPSTLNLIYPEVYLDQGRDEDFISKFTSSLSKYENEGILEPFDGFILIDRQTANIKSRKGIVVALDLELYDFRQGSQTLIRTTEATIAARLPPRMKIREKASVELPHILVLINDPKKTVIEPLFEKKLETAYDFDLMENGGHIKGYKVTGDDVINQIAKGLEALADEESFRKNFPNAPAGAKPPLFAMGDGNHSFATAKVCWDNLKKNGAPMDHPARYALVELQNIHDEGNQFEPIHRLLYNADVDDILAKFDAFVTAKGMSYTFVAGEAAKKSEECSQTSGSGGNEHKIGFRAHCKNGIVHIQNSPFVLAAGTLTDFLDEYLAQVKETTVDYVHGTQAIDKECDKEKTCAFVLPTMSKEQLFETVICNGQLPRKTFSMGHADDKRFYLEARRIIQ